MQPAITKQQVRRLVGKKIYAVKKDGTVVIGKLRKLSGNRLIVEQASGKRAKTNLFIPLVLFDLLAIGLLSEFGHGFGGFGGFGHGFGTFPGQFGFPFF